MLRHPCMLRRPQRQARGAKSEVAISPFLGGQKRAEMLCHPCVLGGPQCQARGAESEIVASPLPRREAQKRAEMLHHPCILTNAKRREEKQSGCGSPDFLAAQKRAEMLHHPCIVGGPQRQARGAKSEVGISPLTSRGAKRGRKCPANHAVSEVPNAKRGEQNHKWLPHPCLVRRPKRGRKCYVTPACSGVLHTKRGEQKQKWLSHS